MVSTLAAAQPMSGGATSSCSFHACTHLERRRTTAHCSLVSLVPVAMQGGAADGEPRWSHDNMRIRLLIETFRRESRVGLANTFGRMASGKGSGQGQTSPSAALFGAKLGLVVRREWKKDLSGEEKDRRA